MKQGRRRELRSEAHDRGDLMRQIAALHAQMARGIYKDDRSRITDVDRQKLLRQIVTLEKLMMES